MKQTFLQYIAYLLKRMWKHERDYLIVLSTTILGICLVTIGAFVLFTYQSLVGLGLTLIGLALVSWYYWLPPIIEEIESIRKDYLDWKKESEKEC